MNINALYTQLQSIDVASWTSPVREQIGIASSAALGIFASPLSLVQIGIGASLGYTKAAYAYRSKSEEVDRSAYEGLHASADWFGSPRNNQLAALSYYIFGSLNDKYRTFFFAEDLYDRIKAPLPFVKGSVIRADQTFIPFLYPDFQSYNQVGDSYSLCYKALYESAFERAHRKKTNSQEVFFDPAGNKLTVTKTALGTYSIEKTSQKNLSTFDYFRMLFSISRNTEFRVSKQLQTSGFKCQSLSPDDLKLIGCYNMTGYTSGVQASLDSKKLSALQLSLPEDRNMSREEINALANMIQRLDSQRIVIQQKDSSAIAQNNAQELSKALLKRHNDKTYQSLCSLAYHAENPKFAIKDPEQFNPVFSEVCLMGYDNPSIVGHTQEKDDSAPESEAFEYVQLGKKLKSSKKNTTSLSWETYENDSPSSQTLVIQFPTLSTENEEGSIQELERKILKSVLPKLQKYHINRLIILEPEDITATQQSLYHKKFETLVQVVSSNPDINKSSLEIEYAEKSSEGINQRVPLRVIHPGTISDNSLRKPWSTTRVFHISLNRPDFKLISIPKTFFAMFLHDFVIDAYNALLRQISELTFPTTFGAFASYGAALLNGILVSPRILITTLMFPLRITFSLIGGAYLYFSGENNNLFEIGPKKEPDYALKRDNFAQCTVNEEAYYQPPMLLSQRPLPPSERRSLTTDDRSLSSSCSDSASDKGSKKKSK